ncbi:hypothetical protein [uncultured Sphingomonas sp.]|uniref:hypothetical protein n=1 Tax=uncultured Sphingomonas sp. TaxID=158754 RepID=UPI0035CC395A
MRFILTLLGLAVVLLVVAMLFGLINFDQTKKAVVQAPEFKMNVGKVAVGSETKTVSVPTISVQKPANATAPAQ